MRDTSQAENHLRSPSSSQEVNLAALAGKLNPKRAAHFLAELANCPIADWPYEDAEDVADWLAHLRERFEEFCPTEYPLSVAHTVRQAWEQPTLRVREAILFPAITEAIYRSAEGDTDRWMHIAAALWASAKFTHHMRVCANPACRARYFVAEKKNQRYCGEKCAGLGQRELKKAWWAEHGPAWRKARKKRAKAKRTGGRKL
jgi:hypothetical protein